MSRRRRVALGLIALLAAVVIAFFLNPDPRLRASRLVRSRLLGLASALSFKENDPSLVRLTYPARLAAFFAERTEADITLGARSAHQSVTRSEIESAAAGLRASNRGLSVQFFDIVVTPDLERGRAEAHLTARVFFLGDQDYLVQEFRLGLVKAEGTWRVHRMATVPTME